MKKIDWTMIKVVLVGMSFIIGTFVYAQKTYVNKDVFEIICQKLDNIEKMLYNISKEVNYNNRR